MLRTIFVFLFGLVTGVALILLLQGPLDWDALRQDAGQALESAEDNARDLSLETRVRAALALQKDFSLTSVGIDADAGVVTLSGTVGGEDARQLAEIIARGVDGVDRVVNDLRVHRADEPVQR